MSAISVYCVNGLCVNVLVVLHLVNVCIPGSTNVGEQLPTGQLSVVPWRRTGVKYTNNEAYFDVVEEIDAIIDKSGIALNSLPFKHFIVPLLHYSASLLVINMLRSTDHLVKKCKSLSFKEKKKLITEQCHRS